MSFNISSGGVRMATMRSMEQLKEYALRELPVDHPLRTVLLAEKDAIPEEEYRAKMKIWLNLSKFER
jgi:hypothetical protein